MRYKKKNNIKLCLLVIAFVFAGAYVWSQSTKRQDSLVDPPLEFADKEHYRVVKVVDGDTVDIFYKGQKKRVRLVGINTPEIYSRPPQRYSKEASTFTKNLLKGEYVYFIHDTLSAKQDRYGRLLGYLYRYPDGLFVNAEILRQGYARVYTRFPFEHKWYFKKLDEHAKRSNKGLWPRP